MKIYTFDNIYYEPANISDPVIEWLDQFDYGHTEDIYPLYENTQDKKLQEILQHADFMVVTRGPLYKRHLLNEGGFGWPEKEADDWFAKFHSAKERWFYLRGAMRGVPRVQLPPYGTWRVRYKRDAPKTEIRWDAGFYYAIQNGDIIKYTSMSHEDFVAHVRALKEKGQIS